MLQLANPKISYILIDTQVENFTEFENNALYERTCSVLYSKDYTVIPLTNFQEGQFKTCLLAIPENLTSDELRRDGVELLHFLHLENLIVKYVDDKNPFELLNSGEEYPLIYEQYKDSLDEKTYIYEGLYFSFRKDQRYYIPKKKEELKSGMIVEYFNNNKWNKKEIVNLDTEYEKMYNLLIRYGKLRIPM